MEVMRNFYPFNNFLHKVRKLANQNGIVLIFDECTSAFRKNYGGLHLHFKVNPDLALFGKALGNGYAITAIIGKRKIMKNSQKTFISSTFWTERIGPTAALASLKTMKKMKSWKIIDIKGKLIIKNWISLSKKNNLTIEISGLPSLCSFRFKLKNHEKYKALITQEMLKKGFLASTTIYLSISHSEQLIKKYLHQLDKVFYLIKKCENGLNINKFLKFKIPKQKFGRLN